MEKALYWRSPPLCKFLFSSWKTNNKIRFFCLYHGSLIKLQDVTILFSFYRIYLNLLAEDKQISMSRPFFAIIFFLYTAMSSDTRSIHSALAYDDIHNGLRFVFIHLSRCFALIYTCAFYHRTCGDLSDSAGIYKARRGRLVIYYIIVPQVYYNKSTLSHMLIFFNLPLFAQELIFFRSFVLSSGLSLHNSWFEIWGCFVWGCRVVRTCARSWKQAVRAGGAHLIYLYIFWAW